MRMARLVATVAMAGTLCLAPMTSTARGQVGADEPALVLQLDFLDVAGTKVHDAAGHGYGAILEGARLVTERKRTAVKFDGHGLVRLTDDAPALPVERRALTVGARCKPASPNGVIVSMGDALNGFSLYLQDGIPRFAVRSKGVLHTVVGSAPLELGAWAHVAGVIGARGELTLVVDTMPDGSARGAMLDGAPAESLTIGADPGSPVADYAGATQWNGLLADVRLYWGEVGRKQAAAILGDWADRPMCGTGQ
jgi:hypothetical protein